MCITKTNSSHPKSNQNDKGRVVNLEDETVNEVSTLYKTQTLCYTKQKEVMIW